MSRGDRRENIFRGAVDRKRFLATLGWIAERLHMGSWTYVSNLLNGKSRH